VISSKKKVLKSPIIDLRTAVKKLIIINYDETEEDSQILTESNELYSE